MNHKLQPEQIEAAKESLHENADYPIGSMKEQSLNKFFDYGVSRANAHYLPILQKQSELLERALGILKKVPTHKESGRAGCCYGDTDYDSLSVCYGYNMAIENFPSVATTITEIEQHLKPKS